MSECFFRASSSITPTNSLPSIPFPKEYEDEETVKANILQRTRVVLSSRESSQTFDDIWNKKEAIAVDCEGISLGTKGQLTTIQVGIQIRIQLLNWQKFHRFI